jgi:ribosomal protein S18 acetylase RimI-like enzyme
MICRSAKPDDYRAMAAIHHKAFSGFFLTSLGIRFLETYYKACIKHPDSIAVCAIDANGSMLGFATGSIKAAGYHRNLLFQNPLGFLASALRSVLLKPSVLIRLIKNLDKNLSENDDRNYAELLSIAILPQLKGSGAGKALLEMFEEEVKEKGGCKIALTTDYENNDRVIAFYQKFGYEIFYDFKTYPDRHMYKMIKTLSANS